MKWYIILIIALSGTLILTYIVLSVIIGAMVVYTKRSSREELRVKNLEKGIDDKILERIPVEFIMKDGYLIHGDYSFGDKKDKFIILCHGYGSNREGVLRYRLMFHKLGYSTLVYDQRSHGDNIHKDITMGHKESKDLSEIIKQVKDKFNIQYIGLFGVSMGAATVLLALKYNQDIKFVIEDCGYAELGNVISLKVKKHHLNFKYFAPMTSLYLKVFHHFWLKDVSYIKNVDNNKVPILIIHGEKDDFVPVENAYILNDHIKSYHKMVIFEDAGHVQSMTVNKEKYTDEIKCFINFEEEN